MRMSKKKTKDTKIKKIVKLISDGKLDKALELANVNDVEDLFKIGTLFGQRGNYNVAEKIFDRIIQLNPNDADAWYNKGVALGNLGKHNEAIKCYDEAIKIKPNYDNAWSNKGVAMGNLGKYDEEIKCYDEAIKINPNLAEAWSNKGVALGNLGKYDEEIKCYDEAIKINPNIAEAHGNKGIIFLNRHRYDEAEKELKIAKEIFSKRGVENDADKARRLELLAKNASKLMSKLKPLDEKFESCCLRSQSLSELKNKSLEVSKGIKSVIEDFGKMKLPEDSIQLLKSKEICFTALSKSLNFEKVDLEILRETEKVFENWGLNTLATAVSFLAAFIHALGRYNNLNEISKEAEEQLLKALGTSYVLDGKLTEEIFKSEPYVTKPAGIEKEIEIKYVCIADIEKELVRVCLAQLDFSLTNTFPYKLIEKEKVRKKIFEALEIAKNKKVNIICFPELSFAKEFVDELKKYNDMIIIGGSFYDNNFNICPVIIGGEPNYVYKIHPSPYLESEIAPGKGMRQGKDLKIFGTYDGKFKFGVLICLDYLEESNRLFQYQYKGKKGVNFIFNPSFNSDPERFQRRANSDCENYHVDVIQTNVKEYGKTCVIGIEHHDVIRRLINEGYRDDDDIKYKLCEASNEDEVLIIADLNLEGVRVPTPVEAKPRINIIGRYKYKNSCWQE